MVRVPATVDRVRLWRPQLTGRNMMIAAMALFLLVVLAPALQTYLNRRSALADAERQGRELNAQISQLQAESKLWDDPAYVERQARERLQYIRPGDTLYTVLNSDGTARDRTKAAIGVAPKVAEPLWSTKLWSSLRAADNAK